MQTWARVECIHVLQDINQCYFVQGLLIFSISTFEVTGIGVSFCSKKNGFCCVTLLDGCGLKWKDCSFSSQYAGDTIFFLGTSEKS